MLHFVLKRLLIAIPLLLVASFLVFLLVINAGEPAQIEVLRARPGVREATITRLKHEYGLDKPWYERYGAWISGAAHGDFGKDQHGQPVWPKVRAALFVTLRLVLVAELLAIILGVAVGVISAVRQYTAFDYTMTGLSFLFFAMPVFWFAILLKEFGGIRFNRFLEHFGVTHFVKTTGYQTPGFHGNVIERVGDAAGYVILPVITLTAISFGALSRFQRSSMLDTLSADYVRTARAKGLSTRRVIVRHALRNALIPVTTLVALDFGMLLGGAVITERVFGWQGMGTLFIDSVTLIDPNILLCWLMITATTVVVFNIVADVAYAYLDPRIRVG